MALIRCSDCGKEISSSAQSCPNCGRPLSAGPSGTVSTKRRGGMYEFVGTMMIVAGIVCLFVNGVFATALIVVGLGVFIAGRFM